MEKTNFTIIIPHYNIPDLLMRCLKSIPIREDIQVIVVDDCSPNAETYKLTYPELSRPFLEYYSTVKGGSAGRARNVGLDHARGKWILFADADDFFENGFMSTLDSYLNSEADVVIFDYRSVLSDNLSIPSERDNSHRPFLHNYPKSDIYARSYFPCPIAKMIKRSLVEKHGIRFDETKWSNDFYFSVSVGCHAANIIIDSHVIYVICERNTSLTSNFCGSYDENKVRAEVAIRCLNLSCENNYILREIKHPLIDIMRKMWKKDKWCFLKLYLSLSPISEDIFYNQFCNGARWKRKTIMFLFRHYYFLQKRLNK